MHVSNFKGLNFKNASSDLEMDLTTVPLAAGGTNTKILS
jgi:hypothetical protein